MPQDVKAVALEGMKKRPEQCCTCLKWHPSHDDHEIGYCNHRPMRSMQPVTLWSDGCKHWESNTPEAA